MPEPGQRRLLNRARLDEPAAEEIDQFVDLVLAALEVPEVQERVAAIAAERQRRAAATYSPPGRGKAVPRGRR